MSQPPRPTATSAVARPPSSPRLAARAVIVERDRLLIVNAYPGDESDLWCAPGGGVERGASLPDTLKREMFEELGMSITVGDPCLINEFHDPDRGFHQVDLYFRARILARAKGAWQDTAGVVNRHRWVTRAELGQLRHKPDSLGSVAFEPDKGLLYDPLERIVR